MLSKKNLLASHIGLDPRDYTRKMRQQDKQLIMQYNPLFSDIRLSLPKGHDLGQCGDKYPPHRIDLCLQRE